MSHPLVFALQPLAGYFENIQKLDGTLPKLHLAQKLNLPAEFSLKKYVKNIYYQGKLGACTAFAIKGILKVLYPQKDFSALFLYQLELMKDHPTRKYIQDVGSNALTGLQVISMTGICEEKYFPYTLDQKAIPINFGKPIPFEAYKNAQLHKFIRYSDVSKNFKNPLTTIQTCLNEGYFVLMAFVVYESFMSDEVISTGIMPMPKPKESLKGSHQVYVCGYDEHYLTCVNSWSEMWGMKGFFKMPIAYLNQKCEYQGMSKKCVEQLLVIDKIPNFQTQEVLSLSPLPSSSVDLNQLLNDVHSIISQLVVLQYKLSLLVSKQK